MNLRILRTGLKRLLLTVGLALGVHAQNTVIDDTVFTLGTVTRDAMNRDWAFLAVQPTDASLLASRKLAIYLKAGDAASSSPYTRRAILTVQTDPATLTVLLDRAAQLGDSLAELEGRIDNLFAALMPAGSLTLPEKLGAVIRGSIADPVHFENLVQLSRLHPGVALAIGFAHAERIGPAGLSTFEVRDYDPSTNADRGVLGRVTVESGQPTVLPAPGPLFEVRDASGKGHLNVKLRWATSPDFRRLALLSYGFNLYRVDRAFAEDPARKFHLNPPAPSVLATLAAGNPAVHKVNPLPILASGQFNDAPAAQVDSVFNATNRVALFADDNGLARGGQPFPDGAEFYYFVSGRDLLGRDGLVSPGILVTLCDRIPPEAPRMPKVENHYAFVGGSPQQHLRISWKPVSPSDGESGIAGYYVYRWRAPGDVSRFEQNPVVNRVSALIPHVDGQSEYVFLDTGGGAPTVPADLGKTFWYTIRSVDEGACDGGNLSPNSAPSFGVLRDREGPVAPSGGGPSLLCCRPDIRVDKPRDETRETAADPGVARFELTCLRRDDGIRWAEFWISYNGGISSNFVGRFPFEPGSDRVVRPLTVPVRLLGDQPNQVVYCRVGDALGKASPQESLRDAGLPERSEVRVFPFVGLSDCERIPYDDKAIRLGCTTHFPRPPKTPGAPEDPEEVGVVVQIPLTPTTREFRLYRRVDFGPLTLIKQGLSTYDAVTNLVVEIPDNDMPANSGHLCYYGQLFDEQGNPSPLTQLGLCLPIHLPTAKPLLAPLEAAGTENAPEMRIRWFCPPAGIERFQVWLGVVGEAPPATLGPVLSSNRAPALNFEAVGFLPTTPPSPMLVDFGTYLTPQPGLNFGDGATFEVTVPIQLGKRYQVRIKPVTKGGALGQTSNTESFLWKAPPAAMGPQVPWPARPLPSVALFDLRVAPVRINNPPLDTVGIRIGTLRREDILTTKEGDQEVVLLRDAASPLEFVYTNQYAEPLIPSFALYRYQLPNTGFPQVSGDVTQVSPLMEGIAAAPVTVPNVGTLTRIHDPFIHLARATGENATGHAEMYLLDTQPLVVGARYAYLLVRFTGAGEVQQVVPTAFIDVFPNPQ